MMALSISLGVKERAPTQHLDALQDKTVHEEYSNARAIENARNILR